MPVIGFFIYIQKLKSKIKYFIKHKIMKPQIICIDGNIGVGKSSIIEKLKNLGFVSFHENLEYWGSLLDMFYENPQRW
jgi:deoxyadenosine/deoxycytidine kinase